MARSAPTRYAVLLRGVNVGGHRRVPMKDWARQLESLGYTDVSTYLQSGNAVLTSDAPPQTLARDIDAALADGMGVRTDVLVRTGPELAGVLAANPFPEAVENPKFLHVAFLSAAPEKGATDAVDPRAYEPDRFALVDRELYLWYRTSPGRSKLSGDGLRLKVIATARNWTTVQALADRTAG